MAKVQDVALFFIDIAAKQAEQEIGDLMTNLRLQKLLYFAQGWHLARYGRPLFDAEFKAWTYGPVVPSIYSQYKDQKNQGILCPNPPADDAFTDDEYALLLDVAREYNNLSTARLVNLSHDAKGPWAQVPQSFTIPQAEIQEYFKGKEPLSSFDDLLESFPVEVF